MSESYTNGESDFNKTENETEKKKGFFAKLKLGLTKTRDALNDKVDNVLKAFKKVDEAEALLLSSC